MDKTVKFNIRLETNGNAVLHRLSVDTEEFREAVGAAVRETRSLASVTENLATMGFAFTAAKDAVDALNRGIGALAAEYNAFDRGMRAVNTMAGLGAGELAALKDQVADLAKTIPLAREEQADGLYQVISNGVPRDNWISFLQASARSAVGGMADLGQTVTVTSTVIKNYGMAWTDAQAIQDKIQTTARNGVTSFEQLASALPRVTGNAATLGVSIDELLGTFATLTGVSGNTAEVSTQLAAVFTALAKPSSEAAEMAARMGIQFDAAAIRAAGGMQAFLAQLQGSVAAYSAASGMLETEVYGRLFGSAEALRALIPLQGELSESFDRNVSAMADSAGTTADAFEEMAGSADSVSRMLRNQIASMTDLAGSLASSAQPYMNFLATTGQTLYALGLMASMTRKAAASVMALAAAHRSNAVVSALAALHTRMVAAAQRLLASASITATAGTTALTVAVTALYAAATMGLSIVITALVALFSSMGDEAEDASGKVDALRESTEAFNRTAASARADIDMELAALRRLMKGQGDEQKTIDTLNRKYGEALGQHRSAAEWYKVLVSNSRAYCDQLAYEAKAKALASAIAERELEKEQKMRQWAYLRQQSMDSRGRVRYNYQQTTGGKKQYEDLGKEIVSLNSDIAAMQAQYDSALDRMAQAAAEMQTTTEETKETVTWETASYTRLGELIEEQKKKVGDLAGVNDKQAKAEAAMLDRMEERYKKLGKDYGLQKDTSAGKTKDTDRDKLSGKALIVNARSYAELGNNIRYYDKCLQELDPSQQEEIRRLTMLKQEAEKAQAALKAMMDAMGRPAELTSLEDFDREIQYQQSLRAKASADRLAAIDREIERLNGLRTAFEEASHTPLLQEEIRTYRQLDAEIAFYEKKIKNASETEREELQKQIISLRRLRQEWDDTLQAMDMPEDISRLSTIEDLDRAISYYSDRQQKASAGEISSLQRTLNLLNDKRSAMQRLTQLPAMRDELDGLDRLQGKQLRLELDLIGLDAVKDKIRSLQKMLDDTKNPLTGSDREEVQKMVHEWQRYEKQIKKNNVTFSRAWGNIKGISSAVTGISDALHGNQSAWEKTMAVVDGALSLYEGISGIIGIIQALTSVTKLQTGAKIAETSATAASETAQGVELGMQAAMLPVKSAATAVNKELTDSYLELAAAEYFAAHAYIPFAGFGIAAGFAAGAVAVTKSIGMMPFANGGLVYGPTLGLVGEYAGASSNPEVIAPLDKLRGILGEGAGTESGGTQKVEFRLRGRNLVGVMEREDRLRRRS